VIPHPRQFTSPNRGTPCLPLAYAIGLHAVEERCHFRDLHTTILHQLGLDQDKLTYPHLGRQERLTQVHGRVLRKIV
jgi:hypothetical protein